MSLVYVTGLSGTGKSQVLKELQTRGFEAHGTDEHGYAKWVNKLNGAVEEFPEDQQGFDIHIWFKEHRWVLNADKISELKAEADNRDKPVFLCGAAEEEDKVWDKFSKVIALVIDEATLRHRVANRTDNDFGKAPEELASILKWYPDYEKNLRNLGAVIIDATQSLDKVVDEIVAEANI